MVEVRADPQTVLIADDEAALRILVAASLEVLGVRVCEACNGQEAIDQALTERPDLVVLDWSMPLVSGLEVLERLRFGGIEAPVILLTARAQIADRLESHRHGTTAFMVKPFSPERLVALVARLLGIDHPPPEELDTGRTNSASDP